MLEFIPRYEQTGLVDFAEPDYVRHASLAPNDPRYVDGTLWALHNMDPESDIPNADIDAVEGWDVLTSAGSIVVAVLDTGIRYTHEDLASNMWVSPHDGGHGFNAITGTNNPSDDNRHGTLMAGIIGAVGNNGIGVAGVAWRVQILGCKCLDSSGNGSDSAIVACIDYARTNGASIINASFSGPAYSQSVSNAIVSARDAGIIFVSSAGNDTTDIDRSPVYPAAYAIDNIVSVAYTTRNDTLGLLSNYGATNVDLAAPGDQIYSTSNGSDGAYYPPSFLNVAGTSYAAPYVSGTFALVRAKYSAETHQQIIGRVLNGADRLVSLAGKCVTGGRLNLRNALGPPIHLTAISATVGDPFRLRLQGIPNRSWVIEAGTNLVDWTPVFTNATSQNGTFDFYDVHGTGVTPRFYRAASFNSPP